MFAEPLRSAWPQRPFALEVLSLLLINLGFSIGALLIARQPGAVASIWLANAASISVLVSSPRRRGPALLATAAGANVLVNLLHGDPWRVALAFATPNTLEIALATWLLHRTQLVHRFTSNHATFLKVIAAGALLAPLAGATMGALLLDLADFAQFSQVWLAWYVGSAISAVALLPLALSLRAMPIREWMPRLFIGQRLLLSGAVLIISGLTLRYLNYPFVLISTLLVLLATVTSRLQMFALTLVVVCSMAVALGFGWLLPDADAVRLGHVQVYLATLLVVGPAQMVAVAMAGQRALGEMLSAVGSRADSIVVFADMAGVYRWVNRAMAAYSGVPNETALGRTFAENLPPTLHATLQPALEAGFAGEVIQVQRELDLPTRGRRVMDVLIHPALDEEGKQIGVVFSATDVTELADSRDHVGRVVEELRATNQDLEQFVRIASHDMREPLNTITQFCDVISRTNAHEFDEATQQYFRLVRGGASRMRSLLDDVLRFVRLGAGPPSPPTVVDLAEVAVEVVESLAAQLGAAGGAVQVHALGAVRGHRSLISLALQNLVSNAIKFVPPERPPRVEIAGAVDGDWYRLTVTDNGIGIDPAHLAELGQPFRRLHARRKFDGTGLGLAICKRIAEQHGGALEIQSIPDQGSQLHLRLPNGPPPAPAPPAGS